MTTARANPTDRRGAFTLIELIGVLAIMSILAAAVVPNAIRALDRASVRAEADNLHNLGEILKIYVSETNSVPSAGNWTTALAPYASANPVDLQYNKRQPTSGGGAIPRRYAYDGTNQRAMFISSMRSNTALPDDATIAANFAAIWSWNSADTSSAYTPAGFNAWVPSLREFLVIERINLKSELPQLQFIFRNQSTKPASYRVYSAAGTQIGATINIPANTFPTYNHRSNQRLCLYDGNGVLNYSFVVSTQPKNFVFDGTNWTPQ